MEEAYILFTMLAFPRPYKPSTMIDLHARKPMEVKYLFRRAVDRADDLGVPVPHLETLVSQSECVLRLDIVFFESDDQIFYVIMSFKLLIVLSLYLQLNLTRGIITYSNPYLFLLMHRLRMLYLSMGEIMMLTSDTKKRI